MTAAHAHTTEFTTPSERDITITRTFDAPRELVFAAWTDPAHLPNWLGPAKHTMTVCEIDLRVGGDYRYVWALAPEGELEMGGTFTEIDAPSRLVSTEWMKGYPGECVNELVLTEADGRTTAVLTSTYPSNEIRDMAMASGMQGGVIEGFERLDALLAA